jgi:hypothetical protein
VLEHALETGAVQQAGQVVVGGRVQELLTENVFLGDVLALQHQVDERAVFGLDAGQRRPDPPGHVGVVDDSHLDRLLFGAVERQRGELVEAVAVVGDHQVDHGRPGQVDLGPTAQVGQRGVQPDESPVVVDERHPER